MWKAFQYVGCNFGVEKIPGDPDIAGLGVITAFIVTAWITIGVATVASLHDWLRVDYKFALGAQELLGPLCDLQAITGAAIVIAGFSQWDTITFYHREMVLAYWWLTSTSFWISRPAYMHTAGKTPETAAWTRWRVFTRRLLIIVSVFLGLVWAVSSILLELDLHWDEEDPQKCYHYNDITYDNRAMALNWIWLAGLSIYQLTLIWSFVDQKGMLSDIWDKWGDDCQNFFERVKRDFSEKSAKTPWRSGTFPLLQFLYERSVTMCSWIMYHLIVLGRVLISVWSYGDSKTEGFVGIYYIFIAWNTWDIIMLKVMNEPLVDDESGMGFGQVLPLVLLTQIGLSIVDIWKDPNKQAERVKKEEEREKKREWNSTEMELQ